VKKGLKDGLRLRASLERTGRPRGKRSAPATSRSIYGQEFGTSTHNYYTGGFQPRSTGGLENRLRRMIVEIIIFTCRQYGTACRNLFLQAIQLCYPPVEIYFLQAVVITKPPVLKFLNLPPVLKFFHQTLFFILYFNIYIKHTYIHT